MTGQVEFGGIIFSPLTHNNKSPGLPGNLRMPSGRKQYISRTSARVSKSPTGGGYGRLSAASSSSMGGSSFSFESWGGHLPPPPCLSRCLPSGREVSEQQQLSVRLSTVCFLFFKHKVGGGTFVAYLHLMLPDEGGGEDIFTPLPRQLATSLAGYIVCQPAAQCFFFPQPVSLQHKVILCNNRFDGHP